MADEHDRSDEFHGEFILPVGSTADSAMGRLIERNEQERDRAAAQQQAWDREKGHFLESLNPVQLSTYLKMVKAAGEDKEVAAFLVGEATAILRYMHKVDPETGLDSFAKLLEEPHEG